MSAKTLDSSEDAESGYSCPIHPETLKEKPGSCPQCGMLLTKDASSEDWKNNLL
jgi:hypothetical protein